VATAIRANLLFQAVVLVVALWFLTGAAALPVFALLTGFNYGGVLVLYASSTARIWGDEAVGQVYGLLFSANIPAALSPIVAGFSYDLLGDFQLTLGILGAILVIAALWVWKNSAVINVGLTNKSS
jgi:MFS transporter, OFA family, oxalate/formate antiporter